jgi:WD40 repeat protein/DNA-binding SARP family transcriptional activator
VHLRLLGPLEARIHDSPIELGPRKQRAVLAMLALQAGHAVPVDALMDGLWGEELPSSAPKMLQGYVSHLRAALDGDGARILTRGRGYELELTDGDVDAARFERLLEAGRGREALALWRGDPLADVADEPFAAAQIRRLEELRLRATELAVDADLAAGRHAALVPELDALVAKEPLRERFHAQRMLALYRSGRQSGALDAYREARAALVEAIGVEPGPELRRLHEAILRQDPDLELPGDPPRPPADPGRAEADAARRMGAAADRAAADRAGLRAAEDELAGVMVALQVAREQAGRGRPADAPLVCPFKGLAAFEPEDAAYFCGRERLIAEMVARLAGSPFMGIVGPSGSGKSSALRAGLLPVLAAGVLPGSERWTPVLLRPGEHPLRELERAAGERARGSRRIVAVDQFEELFTVCRDAAERVAFVDALVAAARDPHAHSLVLVAVRADFYGRCAVYPELWRLLAANQVAVGPMRRDELRRAIELPAERAGLTVERDLTDALVADVEGEPGALPLLSTALLELWSGREGARLELAGYARAGGVRGAVARLAEDAYGRLDPGARELARGVLLRLAGEGAGDAVVRVRLRLAELDAPAQRVVSALADERLLTVGDGEVEVAHEALLREWPRLRNWLDDDAEGRRLRQHLRAAAREWDAGGRDAGELYRGARLASALEWAGAHGAELTLAERDFLAAGRAASQRAHRRVRIALAGVAALLVVAVIAGAVAVEQRGNARGQALDAAAQRLGAQSLVEDDVDRSLLLAAQGNALRDSVQTRGNLLAALLRWPAALGVVRGDGRRVISLALSPDGRELSSLDEEGRVRSFDTRTWRPAGPSFELLGFDGTTDQSLSFDALAYSPDGRRLAVGGTAPAVLDARRRTLLTGMQLPADRIVRALRFSPDGRTLYAVVPWHLTDVDQGIAIQRFDAASGRRLGSERHVSRHLVEMVDLMPTRDGRRLVIASRHEPLRVLDTQTLATVARLPVQAERAALAPGDRTLVAGGDDGSVRFADLETGRVRVASDRHGAPVSAAAFAADGQTAVTVAADGSAIAWDVARARERETFAGHTGRVTSVSMSPDGATLYTGGQDGQIVIWDLAGRRRLGRPFETGAVPPTDGKALPAVNPADDLAPFALRPDGRVLAVGRPDGRIARFDAATLRAEGTPFRAVPSGPVVSMAFTPDGKLLLVGGVHGDLTAYDTGGRAVRRFRGHDRPVWTSSFSADGRRMATASLDATVRFWDVRSGRQVRKPLTRADWGLSDASLSPDGTRVAVTHWPGVEVFSVATGRSLVELTDTDTVYDFGRFTPDGTRIVAGSAQGWSRLWSARTGKPVTRRLGGHAGPVAWATTSPDGRTLASGSTDGTVRLYDLASEKPLGAPLPGVPNRAVAPQFTPEGRYLLAITSTGRAFRWDVRMASWRSRACAIAGRPLTRAEWADVLPEYDYAPICAR